MATISPTQSNVQQALASFLSAILPGLPNQQPAVFPGSITGTTLTVTALAGKSPVGIQGTIQNNAPLLGLGVAPGTTIVQQISGTIGGIGTYQISPSQTVPQATMSTGVTIVTGQQNRVAEPANPFFCVMTPIRFDRLATNLDQSEDCKFTGSIAGTVLSVSGVILGSVVAGATIFGTGALLPGTTILTQLSGSVGGSGTYRVNTPQSLGSQTLSCGQKVLIQEAEVTVQLDFHSPDSTAGDFSQIVSTSLRDEFGVSFFAALPPPLNGVVPFYADDPKMVPFINDQNQYEWRFSVDACFQVNQSVSTPIRYADAASVTLADVDALFPP